MNQEAQEYFDKILKKDPEQLTEPEKVFLRARRSYLKKAQLEEYESVLSPKVEKKEPEEQKEVANKDIPEKENQTSEKKETVKTHDKPRKAN